MKENGERRDVTHTASFKQMQKPVSWTPKPLRTILSRSPTGRTLPWLEGGLSRLGSHAQEALAPGEGAWALGEKQLTNRPGKGAPSGLGWEALAASSSHSSPLHC